MFPVVDYRLPGKSFSFIIKTPPATVLIKKAAGIESGSKTPHTDKVGRSRVLKPRDREGQDARI